MSRACVCPIDQRYYVQPSNRALIVLAGRCLFFSKGSLRVCTEITQVTRSIFHTRKECCIAITFLLFNLILVFCFTFFASAGYFWVMFRLIFKLLSLFAWIKVMQQCFLVNCSVFFVPRKNKALSSIHELFLKLWGDLPSSPTWNDKSFFFIRITVLVISANNNKNVFAWLKTNRETMEKKVTYQI